MCGQKKEAPKLHLQDFFSSGYSPNQKQQNKLMTYTKNRPLTLEDIPVRERRINFLSQNLYSIGIDFSGSSLKKSLIDWENLNLDEESLKKLNQSKAKISAIKLFSQLEEKASELNKIRRDIYSYTVFCEGERVVGESRIGNVLEKINFLYDEAARLRQELEEDKSEGLEELVSSLWDFYSTPTFNMLPSEIKSRLNQVRDTFRAEVNTEQLLQVEVKIEKRKSLEEQIKESAELSEQIARREAARNEEAEALALRRIQQQQQESLEKFQSQIFEEVKEEIAIILATQIENIANFDIDKNNALMKKKLEKHLERLTTLSEFDFDGSFVKAKEGLETLKKTWDNHVKGEGHNLLKTQLDLLKADLNHKLSAVNEKETPQLEIDELYYD